MKLLCLAGSLIVVACAAQRSGYLKPAHQGPAGQEVSDAWVAFEQAEASLEDRLQIGAEVAAVEPAARNAHCRKVCDLYRQMRGLARRICHLAEKNGEEPFFQKRCQKARARADRFRTPVLKQCPCQMAGLAPADAQPQ
jgi:hypothetical protein